MARHIIDPGNAPLSLWRALAGADASVGLADSAWPRVEGARRTVENALASGKAIYGVNTGFGKLAQTRIADGELKLLQRNLVLSHAAGVGKPLDERRHAAPRRARAARPD